MCVCLEGLGLEEDCCVTVSVLHREFMGVDADALLEDIERIEAEWNAMSSRKESNVTTLGDMIWAHIRPIQVNEYVQRLWDSMFKGLLHQDDYFYLTQEKAFLKCYRPHNTYIAKGDHSDQVSILLTGKFVIDDEQEDTTSVPKEILPIVRTLCGRQPQHRPMHFLC